MSETDISKVVGMIMQNPALIEQIKNLANSSAGDEETEKNTESSNTEDAPVDSEMTVAASKEDVGKTRRRELLCALKPYVSSERGRAIDTMMSIGDIIDMIKTR